MNIFFLDKDPQIAAQYHCDKHVVKMIVESAQLLSTAHRIIDGELYFELSKNNRQLRRWKLPDERESVLYKAGFYNHPCGVWTRLNSSNYAWLYSLFAFLCDEYTYRYSRIHETDRKLRTLLSNHPKNINSGSLTDPALAMPDSCIREDAVSSYRNYYLTEKTHILNWKVREIPYWVKEIDNV